MFDTLVSFLSSIWQGFWTAIRDFLTSVWTVGIALIGALAWMIDNIKASIVMTIGYIDSIAFGGISASEPGGLGTFCNIANTFFPLAELMSYLIIWFTLMGVLSLYKFIKTWLPTLS